LDAIHKSEEIGFVFEQNTITTLATDAKIKADAFIVPISVTGETLGNLVVEIEGQSPISQTDELINTVARQVAQQIENLRLLDSAERFRFEAEQASRRLTREGWSEYMDANASDGLRYIYDLKEVRTHDRNESQQADESTLSLPLKVRDEAVGELVIQGIGTDDSASRDLINTIAERLGTHIEGLRLSKQTEQALATTKKLAEREQALRQITSAVRGSTDPATILRTAARELGNLLGRKTIIRLATANKTQSSQPATIANNGNELVSPVESPKADGGNE
jgi:GAF domain-containing protein